MGFILHLVKFSGMLKQYLINEKPRMLWFVPVPTIVLVEL